LVDVDDEPDLVDLAHREERVGRAHRLADAGVHIEYEAAERCLEERCGRRPAGFAFALRIEIVSANTDRGEAFRGGALLEHREIGLVLRREDRLAGAQATVGEVASARARPTSTLSTAARMVPATTRWPGSTLICVTRPSIKGPTRATRFGTNSS